VDETAAVAGGGSGSASGAAGADPRGGVLGLLRYRPSARVVRQACLGVLVMNVVIVATGGAVRLTDSGLGCSKWPECTSGSMVPTKRLGVYGIVEFSNRMLTFVLCVVVGVAIVAVMRARPRRRVLVWLSWSMFVGTVAQAVIGGISVRTDLAPIWVALHFLVSMAMVGASYVMWTRAGESDGARRFVVRRDLWLAGLLLLAATAAVLLAGTVVTGSGPHSGSHDAHHRFPFAPQTAAQFHADLVFLVTGLTVALWFGLRATGAPRRAVAAVRDLFWLIMLQGVIGYVQYFTHVPGGLVEVHMIGSCLVWIGAWRALLSMRERALVGGALPEQLGLDDGVDTPTAAAVVRPRVPAAAGVPEPSEP
jgi:cytochrome c oxidase assembly protein subunit 15